MSESDSSTLSSPPATDDEMPEVTTAVQRKKPAPQKKQKSIMTFMEPKSTSAPASPKRKKRPASPPHEEVLADNPDIAFIVMFRSRFTDAFPPKCPHYGPQDIERGAVEPLAASQIESLLCALLGLVLNRKKPVEKGHYGRALEEAIQTQKHQWPREWNGVNPLSGGRSFSTMDPKERITLLKALIIWSLHTSETVNGMIRDGYKTRNSKIKDDINIPLSVQPWGRDGDKRRYWLVEGQDDTSFRVYRESNPALKTNTWWSVAGTIDDLRALSQKLKTEDGTKDAKALSDRILNAIPRFEATEEKRKRREYRLARKAAFARPEPGYRLYEGRTRGKRMRYTFSDDEEETGSDANSIRPARRQSGRNTPVAPAGPTVTASGRQVRSRAIGLYGESLLSGANTNERPSPATADYMRSDASEEPHAGRGRTRGAANANTSLPKKRKHIETYNSVDEMDDEDDAVTSGGEWDGNEDEADQMDVDDDEEESDENENDSDASEPQSRLVKLKFNSWSSLKSSSPAPNDETATANNQSTPNGVSADASEQQTANGFTSSPVNGTASFTQETKHETKFSAPTPPYGGAEDVVAADTKTDPAPTYKVSVVPTPTPAPSL